MIASLKTGDKVRNYLGNIATVIEIESELYQVDKMMYNAHTYITIEYEDGYTFKSSDTSFAFLFMNKTLVKVE